MTSHEKFSFMSIVAGMRTYETMGYCVGRLVYCTINSTTHKWNMIKMQFMQINHNIWTDVFNIIACPMPKMCCLSIHIPPLPCLAIPSMVMPPTLRPLPWLPMHQVLILPLSTISMTWAVQQELIKILLSTHFTKMCISIYSYVFLCMNCKWCKCEVDHATSKSAIKVELTHARPIIMGLSPTHF